MQKKPSVNKKFRQKKISDPEGQAALEETRAIILLSQVHFYFFLTIFLASLNTRCRENLEMVCNSRLSMVFFYVFARNWTMIGNLCGIIYLVRTQNFPKN